MLYKLLFAKVTSNPNRVLKISNSFIKYFALLFGVSVSINAFSQEIPALIKNNNCVTCHVHNKKLMGPSWQDIAAKYKNGNQEDLAISIAQGSVNKWGSMRMPANPQLKKDEVDSILKWVINQ